MAGLVNIGASNRTIWTEWLMESLEQYGYPGPVYLVNPNYEELFGKRSYPSLASLPEVPDIAVVAVPAELAIAQSRELLLAGCKQIVLISNGFGETGTPEGCQREERLRDVFDGHQDVVVVGPNCVGFASFPDSTNVIAQPISYGVVPGPVSIVSQSGGLIAGLLGAFVREGTGADVCYSIGNGTVYGLARMVERVFARPSTEILCAIVEAIDDVPRLAAALTEARSAGKELVTLVLGRSAPGRRAALSHTGAVIGQQEMLTSWLEAHGAIVVGSVEEMARVVKLLQSIGPLAPERGAFVVTASGGAASLTADLAARHGVPLADIGPTTVEAVRELLPPGAFIGNPLDVTAGNGPAGTAPVYDALVKDPGIGCLIEPYVLRWPDQSPRHRWHRDALGRIADSAGAAGRPLIISSVFEQPLNDWALTFSRRPGVSVTSGLEQTMSALAKLYGRPTGEIEGQLRRSPGRSDGLPEGVLVAEAEARVVLEAVGAAVPKGGVVADEEAAVALASGLRLPLVLKLVRPAVAHKQRVGGVRLEIRSMDELREAYRGIAANAVAADVVSRAEDVAMLVTEMVFGPEILVGALRDPVAGPHLTVGVGGWAAEAGAVLGTILLPASSSGLRAAATQWRLPALLGSGRSDRLVSFLALVASEFVSGALAGYRTVEINPLVLAADGPVVADALFVA